MLQAFSLDCPALGRCSRRIRSARQSRHTRRRADHAGDRHGLHRVPRKGNASVSTNSYPDCEKSTLSDDQGAFTIAAVDSSLNFDLLVLADGQRPLLLKKVDPTRGEIKAKMSRTARRCRSRSSR